MPSKVPLAISLLLEDVTREVEVARRAGVRCRSAERGGLGNEVEAARLESWEALNTAVQVFREAINGFGNLHGSVIDRDSIALTMALRRTGIHFRRGLDARDSEERTRAIDDLIAHLRHTTRLARQVLGA